MIFAQLNVHIRAPKEIAPLLDVRVEQTDAEGIVTSSTNLCRTSKIADAQAAMIKRLRGKTRKIIFTCSGTLSFSNKWEEQVNVKEYVYPN